MQGGDGLDGGAARGIEVAEVNEVVRQGSGLVAGPGGKGREQRALVDQAVLEGQQAEEQVAGRVARWGHGGASRSIRGGTVPRRCGRTGTDRLSPQVGIRLNRTGWRSSRQPGRVVPFASASETIPSSLGPDSAGAGGANHWGVAAGPGDEHRHLEMVSDAVNGLPQEQVADQAVPVRADDEQVNRVASQVGDQLAGGVGPVEQDRTGRIAPFAQGVNQPVEVLLVGAGLLVGGLGAQHPRHRRVNHVEQDDLAGARLGLGQAQRG